MFIADLLIIALSWKQLKLPSISEWINKLWYFPTMEYNSAIKQNEVLIHEATEKHLKCMMADENSQTQRTLFYVIPLSEFLIGKNNTKLL